jgi:hypothetical protein
VSLLISGQPGSSQSRSSGLAAGSQVAVAAVVATDIWQAASKIGGKFRRAIYGVTVDATGVPLGSCVVKAHRTSDDALVDQQSADPSGKYEVSVYTEGPFYIDAYKAGSPDVAGTTVNTLVGV